MVMSFAQDGGGFPFFHQSIFDYLCGKELQSIDVNMDIISDCDLHALLTRVITLV